MKVFTLSILLMTILLKETISYNRKLTNIYRHHRNNFHPLYRTEVLDPEECAEEQCERDTIPHVHETPSDLALNEDFNELWPETIGNDLNKRGSSKVVNNYDVIFSLQFYFYFHTFIIKIKIKLNNTQYLFNTILLKLFFIVNRFRM